MLRHIQKRSRVGVHDTDSDSNSDDHSDSSHQTSSHQTQPETDQTDSESDSHSSPSTLRIPQSLLKALENPIIHTNHQSESDHQDSESEATNNTNDSSSHNISTHQPPPKNISSPLCLICPGKQLKTQNLLHEHLHSQAHKRRLDRYRDFIHNPPPHTSLSPDPSEVIELIDALIGPPPVVPLGSITKKQKRKKRKLPKNSQTIEKPTSKPQSTKKTKTHSTEGLESQGSVTTKPIKRRRSRRGKRERQEKLSKNPKPSIT